MNDTGMSNFGSPNGRTIIKSKGQMLKEATLKIGELEREREWLKQRLSYLLVAVNALGLHSKLTPEEAKQVIQDFIKEREVDMQQQMEVAKTKFKDDLAAGKMPEFKVVPNLDKQE